MEKSYFNGRAKEYIGIELLISLITFIENVRPGRMHF